MKNKEKKEIEKHIRSINELRRNFKQPNIRTWNLPRIKWEKGQKEEIMPIFPKFKENSKSTDPRIKPDTKP